MPSELLNLSKQNVAPLSWKSASASDLASVRGVCLDIDDTLSTQGKLLPEAYAALWKLKEAGFLVVPITGRPAGWCDQIARFWPVHAVVGENGAFTFYLTSRGKLQVRQRLDTPAGASTTSLQAKLSQLKQRVLKEFPQAQWASDQSYREYDLAIDVCEDVPAWSDEDVERLLRVCRAEGAHAKLSSIHVNAWFGEYDKKTGFVHWLNQGAPGVPETGMTGKKADVPSLDQWLYIGDSPNDEPMFAHFRYSVGVANLKKYLGRLKHAPTWMTEQESGAGFVEMVDRLIELKKLTSES